MKKVFLCKKRAQQSYHLSGTGDQSQPSTQNISASANKFQSFQKKDSQTPSFLTNVNKRRHSEVRRYIKSQLNDYDYEDAQEEKINIQDLNQWESAKFFGKQKGYSLSTTNFSKTQMKLFAHFKQNEEEEQEKNEQNTQKYDDAQEAVEVELMKRKGKFLLSKQTQPTETFEQMRRSRNLRLMNQVIINKIEKKQDNQNPALDVFNSFKNLTSLFRNFKTIINYKEIYDQIKQHQFKPEDKFINLEAEFSQDLKRQQQNFREVVETQLNLIKDEGIEIQNKKQEIHAIRLQSCTLQEQIQTCYLKLDKIKQYQNKIFNQQKRGRDLKGYNYEKMKEIENKETQQLLYQIETIKSELHLISQKIEEEETELKRLNDKSATSKQDLKDFLFVVLKKDDIQITESLVSVVKLILQVKSHVGNNDLPHFLDHQAKSFILNKAQIELQMDEIKKQIKQILSSTSKKIDVPPPGTNHGARNFHENKLKQVQEYFAHIKNEKMIIRDENFERAIQKPATSSLSKRQESVMVPSQIQNFQIQILQLDHQIAQIDKSEIERLKQICIQRQFSQSQCSRVVKIIQAQFGVKQLAIIIQQVFQDNISALQNDKINRIEPEQNSPKQYDNLDYYKDRQKQILKNIETTPVINYDYDPIDNYSKRGNNFFKNE